MFFSFPKQHITFGYNIKHEEARGNNMSDIERGDLFYATPPSLPPSLA